MSIVFINKDYQSFTRKIIADMAYLAVHKKLRIPKYQYEEGLYIKAGVEVYQLTKDKIIDGDNDFYYFRFPYKISDTEIK